MKTVLWLVVVASGLAFAACSPSETECIGGDVRTCDCGAGAVGSQVCSVDGTGWGACSCGLPDADADADVPDADAGDAPREDSRPEGEGGEGGEVVEEDVGPPPPCNQVTFRYTDGAAASVWVSGTFNAWAATPAAGALAMARSGDTWEATALIEPTGRHEYKLVVDGTRWIPDPSNPEQVPDTFGGYNSVLWVCEASCDTTSFDWRDSVMYFLLVDRFYDSDGRSDPVSGASDGDARTGSSAQYEGGDLAGVTAKLPYLADLGVTAIWLSAPYDNRDVAGASMEPAADSHLYSAYHGYWPSPADISYAAPGSPSPRPRVESRIGSEADLGEMVDAAHAAAAPGGHGIRVLFDYVMKHVDTESALYRSHPDWFARRTDGRFALCGPENLWEDPYWGTRCAFTDYLAPFDFEIPAVRDWSVSDALWWAQTFGIDGFRLDAIKHVPLSWLTELRARLTTEIPAPAGERFYLVGETFVYDDRNLIRSFVDPATKLDGQFDFPLKARLCEAVFTEAGRLDTLAGWMAGNDGFYGANALMTTWIGNHDVPRAIHFASRQIGDCRQGSWTGNSWTADYRQPAEAAPYERLAVAYAVLMTNPGIPLIYYGDEIGLAGGGDPDNRRQMNWDDGSLNAHQLALRTRLGALAHLRAEHPVLGRGRRESIASDQDTWVYRLRGCGADQEVTVAINRADSARDVTLPAGAYVDLLAGGNVDGGVRSIPARSYLVLGPR